MAAAPRGGFSEVEDGTLGDNNSSCSCTRVEEFEDKISSCGDSRNCWLDVVTNDIPV